MEVAEETLSLRKGKKWIENGHRIVIATVIKAWKSAPKPIGSMLIINDEQNFFGSVSGGCIENEVIEAAAEVFASTKRKILSFSIAHPRAWEAGLACGGHIELLLQLGNLQYIDLILNALKKAEPIVWGMGLDSSLDTFIFPKKWTVEERQDPLNQKIDQALGREECCSVTESSQDTFYRVFSSPIKLIIVGAVHIAQILCKFAKLMGYQAIVIDPRRAYANSDRFPGVTILCEWPQTAFSKIKLDDRSAVAVLSHDPKFDDPSLSYALKSKAFYVGALGSRKTSKERNLRLKSLGVNPAQIAKINGPIGLDIKAKTSEEIAVSILGEIVKILRADR